jgi:hypothetical protein
LLATTAADRLQAGGARPEVAAALARLRDPALRRLCEDWGRAAGGGIPAWPGAAPAWLCHLADWTAEVEPVGQRLRYVRVGAELPRFVGVSLEGRHLDEIGNPVFRLVAYQAYRTAAATRAPVAGRFRFMRDFFSGGFERVVLPFGDGPQGPVARMTATFRIRLRAEPWRRAPTEFGEE